MISANNLRLTFGQGTPLENPALRDMSLTVNQGEFVTVIGSNGAGKSTFLNALAGEVLVDSGSIVVDGEDVSRLPTHKRARRVARVFQHLRGAEHRRKPRPGHQAWPEAWTHFGGKTAVP